MTYRYPSPSVTQGRNYADRRDGGGLDTFRIRLRIRAMLRAWGPMTTERILTHMAEFPERMVRTALQLLLENGEVWRPIQQQRWRLMP